MAEVAGAGQPQTRSIRFRIGLHMPEEPLQTADDHDDPQDDEDLVSQLESLLSEDGEDPTDDQEGVAVASVDGSHTDGSDFDALAEDVAALLDTPPSEASEQNREAAAIEDQSSQAIEQHGDRGTPVDVVNAAAATEPDQTASTKVDGPQVIADVVHDAAASSDASEVGRESGPQARTDHPVDAATPVVELTSPAGSEADQGAQRHEQVEEAAPTVEQIDSMLAAAADDAVSEDYETVSDAQAQTAAPRDDSQPAAERQDEWCAPPGNLDQSGPIEGTYITPEQILAGNVSETEPQPQAAIDSAVEEPIEAVATEATAKVAGPTLLSRVLLVLRTEAARLHSRLHRFCAWLNRPVNRLAPAKRTVVGYVGMVTVFNGSVLLVGKLIGVILGN